MKTELLDAWMKRREWKVVDVASALKFSPQTVRNFLQGKRVNDSTKEAFRRLVEGTGPNKKTA